MAIVSLVQSGSLYRAHLLMGIFLLKSKTQRLYPNSHCYVNLVKLLFDDVKIINLLTKLLILGMKIYFQFNEGIGHGSLM